MIRVKLLSGDIYIKDLDNSKIGIIASKKDQAAMTQAVLIQEMNHDVHFIEGSILDLTLDSQLSSEYDSWIVLSKHSSIANKSSLTTHSVGNYGIANSQLGGNDYTLGVSNAFIQSLLLSKLSVYQKNHFEIFSNFDIVCEATHHGPTINKPLTFIEMGSSEKIWSNKSIAKAIAWSVDSFLNEKKNSYSQIETAIGFGGSHYPYKFAKLMIEKTIFIGHILPKYAVSNLNDHIINQMISKTIPKPTVALIDKKGISKKSELKFLLNKYEIEVRMI